MKFSGDLDKNLKLMEKFFTEKFGFSSINRPTFIKDDRIEKELYLSKENPPVSIFIIKYDYDNEEIDFTIQGFPENFLQYTGYLWYFIDPENDKYKNQMVIDEIEEFFKKDKF